MQRCGAGLVGGIDVGAACHEQIYHFEPPHGRGVVKRRGTGFVLAGLAVGTVIEEQGRDIAMAAESGVVQRRRSVGIAGVDVGAVLDQQARDFEVALERGGIERGRAGFGARFGVAAAGQQDLNNIFLTFEHGVLEDVAASDRAFRKQQLHDFAMPRTGGVLDGRGPGAVAGIEFGTMGQQ